MRLVFDDTLQLNVSNFISSFYNVGTSSEEIFSLRGSCGTELSIK